MPGLGPKLGVKRPRDEAANDLTLTLSQAHWGAFAPLALGGGNFRARSNQTLSGIKSGYHEASVTTDTFVFLRAAKDLGNGFHKLPSHAPSNSFFETYTDKVVQSKTLHWLLKYADGFRSDTAQSILSAPQGTAAGHSGSELDLSGQSAAHDLLRAKIMELLRLDPADHKGLSERSLVVVMASTAVSAMAPGRIARSIPTASLKAGEPAQKNWEANRNEAKRRVNELMAELNKDELSFVWKQAQSFIDSTQVGVKDRRRIPSLRATSPQRDESERPQGEVAGGAYLSAEPATLAVKSRPTSLSEVGRYVTEPFRGPRRGLKKAV